MTDRRRPSQATYAAWLIVGGSVFSVVTAWERIAGLHSLATQEALADAVRDNPLGSGMDVATLTQVTHVVSLVGGGAAAAAAILGGQVLRRSPSARIALTALAPLLLVGWLGTAGYFEPLVLAGIALLWLPPTRDWYAGRPPAESGPGREAAGSPYDATSIFRSPVVHAPTQDVPPAGPRPPAQRPEEQPVDRPAPAAWSPAAYTPVGEGARPRALLWACGLTWVFSALAAVMLTVSALALQAMSDSELSDTAERVGVTLPDGLTVADLRSAVVALCAIAVPLCAVAIVLAALVFRGGAPWARIALSVCSGTAGMLCLVLALQSPVLVVPGAAALATTLLLSRREVITWHR